MKNTIVSKLGGGALCELPVMEAPAPQDNSVLISNDKIKKMKVDILQKEVKIRGLGRGGLNFFYFRDLNKQWLIRFR